MKGIIKKTGARRCLLLYHRFFLGHGRGLFFDLEKISVILSYKLTSLACRYVLITLKLSHRYIKFLPLLNTIACFCFLLNTLASRSARELLAGTFLSCRFPGKFPALPIDGCLWNIQRPMGGFTEYPAYFSGSHVPVIRKQEYKCLRFPRIRQLFLS